MKGLKNNLHELDEFLENDNKERRVSFVSADKKARPQRLSLKDKNKF